MKYYVFCTTVLFMLFFSLTGLYLALHSVLRHLDPLLGPATAFAVSIFTLCALIVALAWSVPSRGDAMSLAPRHGEPFHPSRYPMQLSEQHPSPWPRSTN
ncbi:hypothetical protein [Mycetohabitans rhizoxinica]|uniref:hypothetical protein n=1 Tax=Mycetohabitans rhizoxinica TaxID=412963 RepID=UPI0030D61A9C